MTDKREKGSHRIPIRFSDADDEPRPAEDAPVASDPSEADNESEDVFVSGDDLDQYLAGLQGRHRNASENEWLAGFDEKGSFSFHKRDLRG